MTAPTPVQREGQAPEAPATARPADSGRAEPPDAGEEIALLGSAARGRDVLGDRRLQVAAAAGLLVALAVVLLALTRSDGGAESVTAGEATETTVEVEAAAPAGLPTPIRGETSPTAVALPTVPGPPPTPSTAPTTTEAPTTTTTTTPPPPTTRPAPTPGPEEIAPATVPPAPAPAPAPAPPTTVPPVTEPPTTAPPPTVGPPGAVQVGSQGGSIVVTCSANRVALQSTAPSPGFREDVDSDGPKEVKVNFRGERQVSRIDVSCKDGVADPRVRESGRD